MVKRAKLTLDQPVDNETVEPAPNRQETDTQPAKRETTEKHQVAQKKNGGLASAIVLAGLTIASLIIFKRKIF